MILNFSKAGVGRSHEAQARDSEIHRLHPLQAPEAHFQGRLT